MRKTYILIALASAAVFIIRLIPNLVSPIKTFGYDYGFYLFSINHAKWLGWSAFLKSAWTGYGSQLFPIAHSLHIPSESFLFATQLAFSVGTTWAIYYFWKNENHKAGAWAMLICFLSIAQSQLYLMFLWKNLFAFVFFVLAIKFICEHKHKPAILFALLTIMLHRTTGLILILSLAAYAIWLLIEKRYHKIVALSVVAITFTALWSLPLLNKFVLQQFGNSNRDVFNGIFLTFPEYALYSLPLLIIGIAGFIIYPNKRKNLFLHIVAAISITAIILNLPFHNRLWPYFDIALIPYAGYFLAKFPFTTTRKIFAYGLVIMMVFENLSFTLSQHPLITPAEIQEIKEFRTDNPETLVLALSANDAPWLLGFLNKARIAAPGLFENRHTSSEWNDFWSGTAQQKIFFTRYPRPLVLYQKSVQPGQDILECSNQISINFLQYECK